MVSNIDSLPSFSRSREGAWIEIKTTSRLQNKIKSRSREGAWIEIDSVTPQANLAACRSREGAWIEMSRHL